MDMDDRYVSFVQDVHISIHANIRDLRERKNFADPEELSYIEGKLMAYEEIVNMLRSSATEFGLPAEKLGLAKKQ